MEIESDFTGKELSPRISLVVQWLRLRVLDAEDLGSIPGQGTRSHVLQLDPVQPNKYFFKKKEKRTDD